VSRQIVWETQAIDQAAGFLRDDPDGVREMLDAVAPLVDDPRLCRVVPILGHLTCGGCESAVTG
jgi:hypothetical protein